MKPILDMSDEEIIAELQDCKRTCDVVEIFELLTVLNPHLVLTAAREVLREEK
jgi:hypothetical protein